MKSIIHLLAGSALALTLSTAAFAKDMVIGVSWSNFQEERWKTDEAAMKAAIEAAGDTYVSTDAQSSAAKQLSDIESLMAQGVERAHRSGAGHPGDHSRRPGRCR
jgi:D-xylose transport system substrate-binding protein